MKFEIRSEIRSGETPDAFSTIIRVECDSIKQITHNKLELIIDDNLYGRNACLIVHGSVESIGKIYDEVDDI